MKIESFDTIFSLSADELDRTKIIGILIADDLQNHDWLCEILQGGFVGYDKQTDAELREEYIERRNIELMEHGTDAENEMEV